MTRRQRSAARYCPQCSICRYRVSPFDPGAGEAAFRGIRHFVCGPCRARYSHSLSQIEHFGFRFRFVERSEIPRRPDLPGFAQIYKLLLLAKERQEIRQKEVNWMAREQTENIIKLADRVACIVSKTFAVQGDEAALTDEEALIRIRDLLEAIDPQIIERNKKKRLP